MTGAVCLMAAVSTAAAQDGYIKARGKPGAAGVFVDGKFVGPSERFTVPEKYAVSPGEHEIVLKDPRYEDFTTKVTVRAKKTTKISFHMKKAPVPQPPFARLRFGGGEKESFISVAQGDTSPVFINGKFYGYLDELNNIGGGLLLPPGKYEVKCTSPIFGDISQMVSLEANKVVVIPLKK
ncbi:MAG: PEGA domain-containing protein [Bryobacteraceae bacterium]